MLVPGVSGGSMAMILGIYQKLISAISSFWENKKKNLIFLLLFYLWIVLWLPTVLHRTKNGTAIPNPFSEQILMYVPLLCASLLQ